MTDLERLLAESLEQQKQQTRMLGTISTIAKLYMLLTLGAIALSFCAAALV